MLLIKINTGTPKEKKKKKIMLSGHHCPSF
jgi:hypothetical protein